MDTATHPDTGRLAAYRDGKLPCGEAEAVASHLAGCPACRETLESLPDDDRLATLLRSLPADLRPPGRLEGVPACLAGHPRYEVVGELGRGGMGVVYKARHKLMGRDVALKLIRPLPASRPGAAERFRREVEAASLLDHPNVVRVFDADEAGGTLFLVMELVEGTDLARLVRERGRLPVREACGHARQVALGLQHAHERGLVHRDVKPSNAILTPGGVVKVLDFGLASLLGDVEAAQEKGRDADGPGCGSLTTLGGNGMGTPDYVAPEQAVDARLADIRSDIYSLGATLYHLLAGTPPFGDGDASRRVLAQMVRTPKPLVEVRRDVPAGLARVLAKMMAKDAGQRHQTPAEAAEALRPFASPLRPSRRRFLAGSLAAGGAVAAGLAWVLWGRGSPRRAREVRRFEGPTRPVQCVAFSADESAILAGSDDGRVRVWDGGTGGLAGEWQAHRGWVLALALLPGGRAVTASNDRTLRVWDVAAGREVRTLEGHGGTVTCVAASSDGGRILSGGDDQTVRLWDAGDGRQLLLLEGHAGPVQRVGFSPDGRQAVSGGNDRTVRLWGFDAGRELLRMEGHAGVVTDAAFCPEGRLLSGSYDATARVWDAVSGREEGRRTFPLRVARVFVRGRRLLGACVDDGGDCRLYDAATGEELCRFPGHRAAVWAVALSQEGSRAVTGDGTGRIVIWELPG